MSTITSV